MKMLIFKQIFIISFLTLNGKCQYLRERSDTTTAAARITCQVGDIDFWKLYNWHFGNATSVNIQLLLRTKPEYVQRYLSNILQYLFGQNHYKRTFTIHSYNISSLANKPSSSSDDDDQQLDLADMNFVLNLDKSLDATNVFMFRSYKQFNYLQKLRRLSGDPEHAIFIVTWDVEDLQAFFKEHSKQVENPRGCYMLVFVSPDDVAATAQIEIDLEMALKMLWETYGILNIYVRMPCNVRYNHVTFQYNPFKYANGKWGTLRSFTVNEALVNSKQVRHNVRNLHGYPVAISMFVRRPSAVLNHPRSFADNRIYSVVMEKSGGYAGVDGMVLATIADHLNFTPIINTPPPDREYGFVASNGTVVGSLGDVVNRVVAASFNARFISVYDGAVEGGYEFTTPMTNDFLCFMVPKAEKIPQWMIIFHCFSAEAWMSIFAFYLIVSTYWYLVKHINVTGGSHHRRRRITDERQCCSDAFIEVLAIFISVPLRNVSLNNQRIFIAFCLVFNIVFVSCFQGSLYQSYSKTLYFRDIDTLDQLDKSDIKIVTTSKSMLEVFGNDTKPVMRRLKQKILLLNVTSSLDKAAASRDLAAFERKNDARIRVKTEYTRKSDGMELLHVMRECPWSYYVAYIVPKGSPYLPVFNSLITKFREAGLISKWSLDTADAFIMERRVHPSVASDDVFKAFTMADMQTAFLLLAIGLGIAITVFMLEFYFI